MIVWQICFFRTNQGCWSQIMSRQLWEHCTLAAFPQHFFIQTQSLWFTFILCSPPHPLPCVTCTLVKFIYLCYILVFPCGHFQLMIFIYWSFTALSTSKHHKMWTHISHIHIFIVHICLYYRRVLRKCCVGVLYAAKVFESLIICHLHFYHFKVNEIENLWRFAVICCVSVWMCLRVCVFCRDWDGGDGEVQDLRIVHVKRAKHYGWGEERCGCSIWSPEEQVLGHMRAHMRANWNYEYRQNAHTLLCLVFKVFVCLNRWSLVVSLDFFYKSKQWRS